ncbi:MAG: DUF1838 domain-containing protein [Gammaproteobacteria bacterium]|nr:DUF1838 domain-containing protein [Gammaproteobacteria bacterium]
MLKSLISLSIATLVASCLTLGTVQAAQRAKRIDLNTPEGATLALRRIQCGSVDNTPTIYSFHGEAFSRVPGERDRKLFEVEGYNVRQCVTVTDPVRGTGWRLVSRELLFYIDPATGELLKVWSNPWTGQSVKVMQTANDPVNQRPVFPVGADGRPTTWPATTSGDTWWNTITVPLLYINPLGGEFQKNVGGYYHATEMFNFFGNVSTLTDPKIPNPPIEVGWVRIADWLPWMEMSGRVGLIYMHAAGRKLDHHDQLPDIMKKTIESDYPEYGMPPDGADTRENETSWTYFKKKVAPTTPVKK